MDIYLAGVTSSAQSKWSKYGVSLLDGYTDEQIAEISMLESFYYATSSTVKLIPHLKRFLLDSGAFTFMGGKKSAIDWDSYVERYSRFISDNDVRLFFELDIDSVVGYERVLELRDKLENLTGKRCIPVWHKSRGKDEFLKMCDEYDYVAIGGIASKEIVKREYGVFRWFIKEANKRGAKIHGLGFTDARYFDKIRFDSVDSSTWNIGQRFACTVVYKNGHIKQVKKPDGMRLANKEALTKYNFGQWVRYQTYAREHL